MASLSNTDARSNFTVHTVYLLFNNLDRVVTNRVVSATLQFGDQIGDPTTSCKCRLSRQRNAAITNRQLRNCQCHVCTNKRVNSATEWGLDGE